MSTAGGECEGSHLRVAAREEGRAREAEEDDIEEPGEGENGVRDDRRAEWDVTTAKRFESDYGDGEDGDSVN